MIPILALVATLLGAEPPQATTPKAELRHWSRWVQQKNVEAMASRIEGRAIVVRTEGQPGVVELDATRLRAVMAEEGGPRRVGLDPSLLLPLARYLTGEGAIRSAEDKRCPEVVWRFERVGKYWRLFEILRRPLDC